MHRVIIISQIGDIIFTRMKYIPLNCEMPFYGNATFRNYTNTLGQEKTLLNHQPN